MGKPIMGVGSTLYDSSGNEVGVAKSNYTPISDATRISYLDVERGYAEETGTKNGVTTSYISDSKSRSLLANTSALTYMVYDKGCLFHGSYL